MPEIQSGKYKVSVTLVSNQEGEQSVLKVTGEAVTRGTQTYIRYVEPGQGPQDSEAEVRTTIKITDSGLKIIRHGGVQSEQSFQPHTRQPGFYRSPYTQFNLSTETRGMDRVRKDRSLEICWEYDLYVYEELSGKFAISLHIQEEPES